MIDRALARFLEEGLSLHVGVRDANLQPEGARAAAVRIEPDGQHLELYVPDVAAARLLPAIESNGQVAISFGRPEDERACQVKGTAVGVRQALDSERAIVDAQWEGFMRQFEIVGIPRAMAAGWIRWPAVAVRLKITAVFEQTPGPQAGTAIA